MLDNTTGVERRSLLKALGLTGIAAAVGSVSGDHRRGRGGASNRMLVGVSAAHKMASVRSDVEQDLPENARVLRENETLGYMEVELPEQASAQAMTAMQNKPGIEYTEENETYEIQATPSDDLFGEQYAPQQVNAPVAWDTTFGSDDVTIAVIDQGVCTTTPT